MSTEVADHKERSRALDPRGSFIVQAPAGSGKTELLIQRYLALLALVDHPEEIIAITFTVKAAAEMRCRVMDALASAQSGTEPENEYARTTFALARQVLQRDAACGWELDASPGRLRVQTVDAMSAHLVRRMPVLSRLGARPETLENPAAMYLQAAEAALAQLEDPGPEGDAVAVLLEHMDNDLPRARDLLAGMLARREQWLPHVFEVRRAPLEAALSRLVENALESLSASFPKNAARELLELLSCAAGNLERGGADSPIRLCAGLDALPGTGAECLAQWQAIAGFLLTGSGTWRATATERIGFPAAGSGAGAAERKEMKSRFRDLLAVLSRHEGLRRQLEDVSTLPPNRYTEREWEVVAALARVLVLADAHLSVLFAEHDCVDFAGITRAAAAALGSEEEPTDLALHLDYAIRHILVDEFQDISVSQFSLLRLLTAGWSKGDGRTLFLVGDPMQSIYRFREAEVGLFLDVRERRRLGQVPVVPLAIAVNFRSAPAIVDWVNSTFRQVLPEQSDSVRGAVTYAEARAFHDDAPETGVTVHAFVRDGNEAEAEAARVTDLIRAAHEARPGGSVAVLVRSRSMLPAIVARLKAEGMRPRAVEIEPLGDRPAIQDLLALTRALHHFADRIAWLAVLRAPWCGLELADLLVLAGSDDGMTVWESLWHTDRLAALSESGRRRVERLRELLREVFDDQGRRPLRRWVESAWLRIGGPAALADRSDLENARAYFDVLDDFDSGGTLRDFGEFTECVQALFASPDPDAGEALQIMTIHRAKGLEFDTVIVPGLGRGKGKDQPRLLLWALRAHADGSRDLLLAPIREAGQEESPIYASLKRIEKEKQEFEEGRLLYVAATRARRSLHLLGAVHIREHDDGPEVVAPRSDSMLSALWPAVWQEFDALLDSAATPPVEPDAGATSPGLRRLPADWRLPALSPPFAWQPGMEAPLPAATGAIEFEWAGETVMHIGSVVHRCIRRMAGQRFEDRDRERIRGARPAYSAMLSGLGVPVEELDAAVDDVERALSNLCDDRRGHWLFDPSHRHARDEYALTAMLPDGLVSVILDRTFVDAGGTRWIVDYKTSRHEGPDLDAFLDRERERYRGQLERYAAIMKRLEDRPVRLGLYFPLLRGWREWEYPG
jgi:ATP-dependent helicase/nuclease subunit A